jgi:hypothetical protein
MDKVILIDRVFRINYKTASGKPWKRRVLVFTEALSFAKSRCNEKRTTTIDEILIYSDDSEKVATQWLVTSETLSVI